jgi:hypothetical protein
VLTGSADKTAQLWDSDYRDFTDSAGRRIFRNFTSGERTQHGITDKEPTCPQFATVENPITTPFPPTTTPIPTRIIPVWTPIATPTP